MVFNPNHFFSIQSLLAKLNDDGKKLLVKNKLTELEKELQFRYKLNLRDDSKLAWAYAINDNLTKDYVCQELWIMHQLHTCTNYAQICRQQLPIIHHQLVGNQWWNPEKVEQVRQHIQQFVLPKIQFDCMWKWFNRHSNSNNNSNNN